jgi:GPI-GlcNAc transferase complex PIG-U subunit
LETPAGLGVMFAVALGIRLLIAVCGLLLDLRLFQQWAGRLADVGTQQGPVRGLPARLPLRAVADREDLHNPELPLLLKLPALLADLGLAWIAATFAARVAPESLKQRHAVRALVAAAVLLNPAVIALCAVWGQVDAVPAMFVLWSLLLLFTGTPSLRRDITAVLLFAVAVALKPKPQAGFVVPVMLCALYRHSSRAASPELVDGGLSMAIIGVLSLGLWAISGLAFGLGPVSLVRFYKTSASVYPFTSANAFNLWGAKASGGPTPAATRSRFSASRHRSSGSSR